MWTTERPSLRTVQPGGPPELEDININVDVMFIALLELVQAVLLQDPLVERALRGGTDVRFTTVVAVVCSSVCAGIAWCLINKQACTSISTSTCHPGQHGEQPFVQTVGGRGVALVEGAAGIHAFIRSILEAGRHGIGVAGSYTCVRIRVQICEHVYSMRIDLYAHLCIRVYSPVYGEYAQESRAP